MVHLNSVTSKINTISSVIDQTPQEAWKDLWQLQLEDGLIPFLPNSQESLDRLLNDSTVKQITSPPPERILHEDKVNKDSHRIYQNSTSIPDLSMINPQDLATLESNYYHYYRKQEAAENFQVPLHQVPCRRLSDMSNGIANLQIMPDLSDHMMMSPYSELLTPNWLDTFDINILDQTEDHKQKPGVQVTHPFPWDSPSSLPPSECLDPFENSGQIHTYPSYPLPYPISEHPSAFQPPLGAEEGFGMYYPAYPHPYMMNMPGLGPEEYHHFMGLYEQDNHQKPPFSYSQLITRAILESSERKMLLSDIYNWIIKTFPYYRTTDAPWKNSIRHNLSVNKCFKKVPRRGDQPGKGSYWTLDPDQLDPATTTKSCSLENMKENTPNSTISNVTMKRKSSTMEDKGASLQHKRTKSTDQERYFPVNE